MGIKSYPFFHSQYRNSGDSYKPYMASGNLPRMGKDGFS